MVIKKQRLSHNTWFATNTILVKRLLDTKKVVATDSYRQVIKTFPSLTRFYYFFILDFHTHSVGDMAGGNMHATFERKRE